MPKGRDIKGITIEIGGDTTGLQNALKGVNTQIKTTQAQLKDINTQQIRSYFNRSSRHYLKQSDPRKKSWKP